MNTKMKLIVSFFVFIIFIGTAYFAYFYLSEKFEPNINIDYNNDSSDKDDVISQAPDFTVYDSNGNKVKLSDFFGTPIVLNFWASWCPPCKKEMPDFNEVYAEVKNEITFLMVDVVDGKRETLEKGQKYIESEGFSFPVYFDIEQEAAKAYQITYIPTTVLISTEGNIVSVYQGLIDKETLLSGIVLIKE